MIRPVPSDVDPFEDIAFGLAAGQCPPPETLLPALAGTLPPPFHERMLAHINSCGACRALAAAFEADECSQVTDEEAGRIRNRIAADETHHRRIWTFTAAAAIVIAASGVWILQFQRLRSPAPPAPSPPVATAIVAARTFVLPLDVPEIELPPGALVLRGEAADPSATALTQALEAFRRADYRHAAERLDALLLVHPNEPYAMYYLGVSRLLDGRPIDAVEPLDRVRRLVLPDAWLYPNAAWYLAVALERSNRVDQAVLILTQLCGGGGSRGEQACGSLGTLLAPRIGSRDRGATVPLSSLAGGDPLVQRAGRAAGRPGR